MSNTPGPHSSIPTNSPRDRLLARLLDQLWESYRQRVSYVADYERLIAAAGATFENDHIAFRTFAGQTPLTGIVSLSRLFEALGYVPAGCYQFPDKHLNAIHYQHPQAGFPKLFISELKTWELNELSRQAIHRTLQSHREPISQEVLSRVAGLDSEENMEALLAELSLQIEALPWTPPEKADVLAVNEESQYAAWVLVHGYLVNHFTALINSHRISGWNDIEQTVQQLKSAGVPMKESIEGTPGSKLRQTATEAVQLDVEVRDNGNPAVMNWSYAYFELAERGNLTNPDTGASSRFEGFLGPQATELFEMTKLKEE